MGAGFRDLAHAISLTQQKRSVLLGFDNEGDKLAWMAAITTASQAVQENKKTFTVKRGASDLSTGGGGDDALGTVGVALFFPVSPMLHGYAS
jgi:hypothetical protein